VVSTHEVLNQPPPLTGYDLYRSDPVLASAVAREGGGWAAGQLGELGCRLGSAEVMQWGFEANVHPPVLKTHDRFGHRLDEVEFHPSWHSLMDLSVSHGIHCLPFERPAGEGARVVRDAMFTMVNQVEAGHCCPVSMTTSVLPALRTEPDLAARWEPRILSRSYDPALAAVGAKRGALLGMGMTEKQGGSDVRANISRADPAGDGTYRLTGHKWFTSAPMCDAFLVLAQAPGGLTCFLLPRVLDDGTRNAINLQRLKDKLGNRSNASSEVEFDGAVVHRVGDEGRGVPTIIEMVNHTRLDCVAGSVGLMRQAVSQAGWHAAHRHAFGSALVDKPLMQNVLADLEIEVEAATLMMIRLSGAFDRAELDPGERALRRLATPVAKYWVTKRCTEVVREAMECLGGNGYVEESILPRLFRESPVNAIWEGSGNVIALDVVRALAGGSSPAEAFLAEVELGRGAHPVLDVAIDRLGATLAGLANPEASARLLVEAMALTWAGSLAVRHGDPDVADAYVASRLAGGHGSLYGTLDPGLPIARLAARTVPAA
jgi:putative acyl-CoA dehydrogenase